MVEGEPMMIRCEGGAAAWRTATYPPTVELVVDGGVYVLVDEGSPELWWYQFVDEVVG
jgi:hypothetical protein